MTSNVDQRDMTVGEVNAMPPSKLRDLLVASFVVHQRATAEGFEPHLPMLFKYICAPDLGPGSWVLPIAAYYAGQQATPPTAHGLLDHINEELEGSIDWWDSAVHPTIARGGSFLAISVLYDGWVLPASHPDYDRREPEDVPDSLLARILKGVTTDGAGFVIYQPLGGEMRARIELVAAHTPGSVTLPPADPVLTGLQRTVAMMHTAYTHTAPDPAAYPPPYTPEPITAPEPPEANTDGAALCLDTGTVGWDSISQGPQAQFQPFVPTPDVPTDADTADHPDTGLTESQVRELPPTSLRDAALHALDCEAEHQRRTGWDTNPCIVLRHRLHGQHHQCYVALELDAVVELNAPPEHNPHLPPLARLALLLNDLKSGDPGRVNPELTNGPYFAGGVLTEVAEFVPGSLSLTDAIGVRAHARVIVGIARDGGCYLVYRRRGYLPLVSFAKDTTEAATRFGRDIINSVHSIHAAFVAIDLTTQPTPPPTAPPHEHTAGPSGGSATGAPGESTEQSQPEFAALDDLPPTFPTEDHIPFAVVRTQWRPGEPREGKIYPPLPSEHPLASRPCLCKLPLGNGQPVQTYTVGPIDAAAMGAYFASQPHESVSLVAHQQCILLTATELAGVITSFFEKWRHPGRRRHG